MIELGDLIDNRYRIDGFIGHGGMSDVYEAYDNVMKRKVALKVMREELSGDKKNVDRFKKECILVSSLNDPNIVKVYSEGSIEGRPYLASEYVKGQTLRDKLNTSNSHSLPPLEACNVMLQMTSGVYYIHQHGIVHRDIKPDNIFYPPDGSVKIADFGIADKTGTPQKGDKVSGTVYYSSPESLMGAPANPESDIYSMGIVFFELLTGKIPFDYPSIEDVAVAQAKKKMPEPSKINQNLPKVLDKIIIKACRKRPEERYHTAMEMHDDIKKAMENGNDFKEKRSLLARIFGFK